MSMLITAQVWSRVMASHDAHWDELRPELRRNMLAYEQRYWNKQAQGPLDKGLLLIETSRMYEFVEGYQASLFSKEPAVVVKADIRGRGRADVVQAANNEFLARMRTTMEDASRLANLYPFSAIKLAVVQNEDPYQRIVGVAVPGWDVVVDSAAATWETQRYIGHRYWVSVSEARERWGRKDYRTMERIDYLDRVDATKNPRRVKPSTTLTDELNQFIQVVEVYDLMADRLLVWSGQWKNGDEWLDTGKSIEIDGITKTFDAIPFRTVADKPVVPVYPLYYSRKPHDPLRGIPPARRVYDQCQEVNVARTFQANGTRKCARQWLTRDGALNPDEMSKVSQGVDGEFISVNLSPGESLKDVMVPVPQAETPREVEQYIQQVQSDLDRGSVLAPFTRGQATKGATATEVTALASYAASEIGRLARERDGMIEGVARIYTCMLGLYLDEEGKDIVMLNGEVIVVKPEDFAGDFGYFAQDGGATPISEAQHKSDLLGAVPLLQQLGVPNAVILKEVVRALRLPKDFVAPEAPPALAPNASQATASASPMPEELGLSPGSMPSPQRISAVLPGMQ